MINLLQRAIDCNDTNDELWCPTHTRMTKMREWNEEFSEQYCEAVTKCETIWSAGCVLSNELRASIVRLFRANWKLKVNCCLFAVHQVFTRHESHVQTWTVSYVMCVHTGSQLRCQHAYSISVEWLMMRVMATRKCHPNARTGIGKVIKLIEEFLSRNPPCYIRKVNKTCGSLATNVCDVNTRAAQNILGRMGAESERESRRRACVYDFGSHVRGRGRSLVTLLSRILVVCVRTQKRNDRCQTAPRWASVCTEISRHAD